MLFVGPLQQRMFPSRRVQANGASTQSNGVTTNLANIASADRARGIRVAAHLATASNRLLDLIEDLAALRDGVNVLACELDPGLSKKIKDRLPQAGEEGDEEDDDMEEDELPQSGNKKRKSDPGMPSLEMVIPAEFGVPIVDALGFKKWLKTEVPNTDSSIAGLIRLGRLSKKVGIVVRQDKATQSVAVYKMAMIKAKGATEVSFEIKSLPGDKAVKFDTINQPTAKQALDAFTQIFHITRWQKKWP